MQLCAFTDFVIIR